MGAPRARLKNGPYLSTRLNSDRVTMASRFVMRIELTGPAKAKLAELSDDTGMTQVAIMSRMVQWFSGQPEVIQAAVLRRYPQEVEADIARLLLRKMAGESIPSAMDGVAQKESDRQRS